MKLVIDLTDEKSVQMGISMLARAKEYFDDLLAEVATQDSVSDVGMQDYAFVDSTPSLVSAEALADIKSASMEAEEPNEEELVVEELVAEPAVVEDETAKPAATPTPEEAAKPAATPKPEEVAKPAATPKPEEAAKPAVTPKPEEAAKPAEEPAKEETLADSRRRYRRALNVTTTSEATLTDKQKAVLVEKLQEYSDKKSVMDTYKLLEAHGITKVSEATPEIFEKLVVSLEAN